MTAREAHDPITPPLNVRRGAFSRAVLRWYRVHGRHDLPWQADRDPYRIWVSEIMLQQTQVATVIPYYERFIRRFPDIASLAGAPIDAVLDCWTGLGYYARARNLHRAAHSIQRQHGGVFPRALLAVIALPGIGRSTAGAILSFADQQRHPVLDGNVRRVLARYFAVAGDPTRKATQNILWDRADLVLPRQGGRAADFNQAMMDMGALVCTRTRPDCGACPLEPGCLGYAMGNPLRFPGRPARRPRPARQTTMLILIDPGGRVLLERRPAPGIWGGLWSFPECPAKVMPQAWCRDVFGIPVRPLAPWAPIEQGFTHFTLTIWPQLLRVSGADSVKLGHRGSWIRPGAPGRRGLAAPVTRLLKQLDSAL